MIGLLLAASVAIPREVVVLYNSQERVGLRGEGAPTAVELVLNHLGLIARYRNLALGLPEAELSKRARGVISLAEGNSAPHAEALAGWLEARRRAHQPIVLLGGLPFLEEARTHAPVRPAAWRPLMEGLGVHYGGEYVGDPAKVVLAGFGQGGQFEMPWSEGHLPAFVQAAARPPARRLLSLRRRDTGAVSDVAIAGPAGAVVLGRECLLDVNPLSFRLRWRLDPFKLLGDALHTNGQPRPDCTTVNGRRVFYAQIDGDGFANLARLPGQPLAAEVLRDKLLATSPLPTTVSVIARDVIGHPRETAVARSIYALPNVEAGTHTYNHPHDYERGTLTPRGQVADGDRISGLRPRQPISPRREIDDSVAAINTLLPRGHKVEVVLWSGSTNPTAPFLARARAVGIANLNGGDAMVDPLTPSVANLAPLGRQVGPYLQVYASAANENLFTNLWNGPFDGQRRVIDTFTFSGSPRRLLPVDIYYHFYSGERLASLRALEDAYAWAAAQPLAHLRASWYARTVEGFYGARLQAAGPGVWLASAMGSCRTLRFDHERRSPDLAASTGVAGYNRFGDALYVHLSAPSARVALAAAPEPRPHLESASAPLGSWKLEDGALHATFRAAAPCEVVLAGLPPGTRLQARGRWRFSPLVDRQGRATFHAPAGLQALEVRW